MRAEELRAGNYVSTIYPKFNYEKVKEIKEKVVYTDNIKGIGYISLKPIPLTEEILLNCGFEKREVTIFNSTKIRYINFSFIIEVDFVYNWIGGNINVEHLHQLQNLYYCLTGEELNVKL